METILGRKANATGWCWSIGISNQLGTEANLLRITSPKKERITTTRLDRITDAWFENGGSQHGLGFEAKCKIQSRWLWPHLFSSCLSTAAAADEDNAYVWRFMWGDSRTMIMERLHFHLMDSISFFQGRAAALCGCTLPVAWNSPTETCHVSSRPFCHGTWRSVTATIVHPGVLNLNELCAPPLYTVTCKHDKQVVL